MAVICHIMFLFLSFELHILKKTSVLNSQFLKSQDLAIIVKILININIRIKITTLEVLLTSIHAITNILRFA